MELEELKIEITHKLDVLEFLDILGYDVADLVEVLEDEIETNREELERACR
jgi:hypothetical protein